jgi:hypothetical protein
VSSSLSDLVILLNSDGGGELCRGVTVATHWDPTSQSKKVPPFALCRVIVARTRDGYLGDAYRPFYISSVTLVWWGG